MKKLKLLIIILSVWLIPSTVFAYKNVTVRIYGTNVFNCAGLETTNIDEDILGLSFINAIPINMCMVFNTKHHYFSEMSMRDMYMNVGVIAVSSGRVTQDFIAKKEVSNGQLVNYGFKQRIKTYIEVNRKVINEFNIIPGDIVQIVRKSSY